MLLLSLNCAFVQEGWTALHVAQDQNNMEIGRLLISRGAKVDIAGDVSTMQPSINHTSRFLCYGKHINAVSLEITCFGNCNWSCSLSNMDV